MSEDAPLAPRHPGEPIGIVAGGGTLPAVVAGEAARMGWTPFVVAIADGRTASWADYDNVSLPWGRTGDVFAHFAARGIRDVVFCGTISVRPDYRSMVPSLRTLRMLPEILGITRGGDDSLLRGVAGAFERRGLRVVAVQSIVPSLLLPPGQLNDLQPDPRHRLAISRAEVAATRLGLLDIGQAVVASPDRIIALEGIEGTREMIRRVADLRARGRIGRSEPCVLFKAFKPQQDTRFDLPSIGLETIAQVREAGIEGIAMTAGRSLVIDPQAVAQAAKAAHVFVLGAAPPLEGTPP